MNEDARKWLIVGVVVVAILMVAIMLWDAKKPPEENIEDDTEKMKWTERAREANRDFGLKGEREVGGKWAASSAAILGVLSTVAVVAGPSDLVKDVGGTEARVAAGLILGAAGIAAIATLLAALAEQGTPVTTDMEGDVYRAMIRSRAQRAKWQILWARLLTVLSICLVIGATGVAWLTALAPAKPKDASQKALVVSDLGAQCGTLAPVGQALLLKVGVEGPTPVPKGATVTFVSACPK